MFSSYKRLLSEAIRLVGDETPLDTLNGAVAASELEEDRRLQKAQNAMDPLVHFDEIRFPNNDNNNTGGEESPRPKVCSVRKLVTTAGGVLPLTASLLNVAIDKQKEFLPQRKSLAINTLNLAMRDKEFGSQFASCVAATGGPRLLRFLTESLRARSTGVGACACLLSSLLTCLEEDEQVRLALATVAIDPNIGESLLALVTRAVPNEQHAEEAAWNILQLLFDKVPHFGASLSDGREDWMAVWLASVVDEAVDSGVNSSTDTIWLLCRYSKRLQDAVLLDERLGIMKGLLNLASKSRGRDRNAVRTMARIVRQLDKGSAGQLMMGGGLDDAEHVLLQRPRGLLTVGEISRKVPAFGDSAAAAMLATSTATTTSSSLSSEARAVTRLNEEAISIRWERRGWGVGAVALDFYQHAWTTVEIVCLQAESNKCRRSAALAIGQMSQRSAILAGQFVLSAIKKESGAMFSSSLFEGAPPTVLCLDDNSVEEGVVPKTFISRLCEMMMTTTTIDNSSSNNNIDAATNRHRQILEQLDNGIAVGESALALRELMKNVRGFAGQVEATMGVDRLATCFMIAAEYVTEERIRREKERESIIGLDDQVLRTSQIEEAEENEEWVWGAIETGVKEIGGLAMALRRKIEERRNEKNEMVDSSSNSLSEVDGDDNSSSSSSSNEIDDVLSSRASSMSCSSSSSDESFTPRKRDSISDCETILDGDNKKRKRTVIIAPLHSILPSSSQSGEKIWHLLDSAMNSNTTNPRLAATTARCFQAIWRKVQPSFLDRSGQVLMIPSDVEAVLKRANNILEIPSRMEDEEEK